MAITVYTYNDKVLVNSANDKWLKKVEAPPLPPIPAYTVRAKILTGQEPSSSGPPFTFTLVDAAQNIWDITSQQYFSIIPGFALTKATEVIDWNPGDLTSLSGGTGFGGNYSNPYLTKVTLTNFGNLTNLGSLFYNTDHQLAALEEINLSGTQNITTMIQMFSGLPALTTVPLFDTSSVTDMQSTFANCTSLTSVPLLDTSNVIYMNSMFGGCTSLKSVPLFDTSKATNMSSMFAGCTNVESGALALYQQASSQTTPPEYHVSTFGACGTNTVTGVAEWNQIPASWGGGA